MASLATASIDALLWRASQAWRPPARLDLSQWADAHFYLSVESAAESGKWHTLPYQRGIMDAITDPTVTQVSVMKSARIGYTKCINATVGYYMHQDPCPIMVVQPTIEDAEGYSKEEIAPMLRDCPALAALIPEQRSRDSGSTILHKRFRGGTLSLVGANSGRGFRRVSRKVVIFDEPDGYPVSAGTEGDPILLGIRRSEYYWDRKIIAGSTPSIAGRSRIEQLFHAGDQRRYYVPCPHCDEMQVLQFAQLKWPKGKPKLAVYLCLVCGCEIEYRYQRDMVHAGEWRPGPHAQFTDAPTPEPFHGHASFHLWAAYSFSPNATWGQLCQEFVDAEREGPEHLKTCINNVLGETWKEKGEAPEWERLYERRESYVIGTVPQGALFLTVGADVQHDRIVAEVVGWGRGKTSWSVAWFTLSGETADIDKGPWLELTRVLERTYRHESGFEMPVVVMAVDSGDQTQTVYSWTRRHSITRVIAVKGFAHGGVLLGSPTTVDVTIRGRKLPHGARMFPVAVNLAKSELYGWLRLTAPTDEERAAGATMPSGYCHFPQHPEEYFKELASEQIVETRNRRGFRVHTWEVIRGRKNHTLDARVYARAGAQHFGIDRFKERDWRWLETRMGLPAPVPEGGTTPPPAPPPPAKKPWVKPRPDYWDRSRSRW
jgi:phage terminase large subunit GpA-like protein